VVFDCRSRRQRFFEIKPGKVGLDQYKSRYRSVKVRPARSACDANGIAKSGLGTTNTAIPGAYVRLTGLVKRRQQPLSEKWFRQVSPIFMQFSVPMRLCRPSARESFDDGSRISRYSHLLRQHRALSRQIDTQKPDGGVPPCQEKRRGHNIAVCPPDGKRAVRGSSITILLKSIPGGVRKVCFHPYEKESCNRAHR
jgi:hypothetical protein